MTFKWLKWLRVLISLGFLLLITFAFIDFSGTITPKWYNGILYFQFVPSLLKFLNLLGIMATGFIIVLLLTILFGRIYCSTLCPLGVFQDIFNFVAGKFKKRKQLNKFSKPHNWLRYAILILVILSLIIGQIFLVNLLDPYSIYGKISVNLFRPVYYFSNNILVFFLERMENFTFYHADLKNIGWFTFGFAFFMFLLIGFMAATRGRLFCNTLCPVGTFLGIYLQIFCFQDKIGQSFLHKLWYLRICLQG